MLDVSDRPIPSFCLASSLSALSVLYGRKYTGYRDLRTNLYVLTVAITGQGKNLPYSSLKKLFEMSGLKHYIGGEDMGSAQGITDSFGANQVYSKIFPLDEVGDKLRSWIDPKSPQYLKKIEETMLCLFSIGGGNLYKRALAKSQDGDDSSTEIAEPHLSIYGTTNPDSLYDSLKIRQISNGLLNRLLVFNHIKDYELPLSNVAIKPPPESVLNHFSHIAKFFDGEPGFAADLSKQKKVKYEDGVLELINREFVLEQYKYQRRYTEVGMGPMWSRATEMSSKLAMIKAISRDWRNPTVSKDDATWGWRVAEYCINGFVSQIKSRLFDTEYEKNLMAVKSFIDSSKEGRGPRDIARKFRSFNIKTRDEMVSHLLNAGVIAEKQIGRKLVYISI